MTSHRSRRAALASIGAALCLALPGAAAATPSPGSDAAQSGGTQSPAYVSPGSDAAQSGSDRTGTYPPADFRGGDSPVDHPGATRAQPEAPATIEVVRPERTIVREVDEVLPIALSGAALMLALGGLGVALARTGAMPRFGRTH